MRPAAETRGRPVPDPRVSLRAELGGEGRGGSADSFDLKKKVLRLETLYDVSRSLASVRQEDELLEEIVGRSVAVLDAARGFAATFEDGATAGSVAAVGFGTHPEPLAVASDPFVLDLCRAKAPLSRGGEAVLSRPASSVAGAPLVARNQVLGVIVVVDREVRGDGPSAFDDEDRRFLGSLAALAGPALEAARQFRALANDLDRLREENRALKGTLRVDELLIGDSAPMRRVKDLITRAASSRVSVLVRGESGTGKELVAKLLHALSPRRDAPFLALNCAAVPETLLESELFGIERGVATGVEARLGKFELAGSGTIFLDEIADAPLPIQAKLLRVLQEREIERVGGRQKIPVEARVVTATHADLEEEVRKRRFRDDLYYRLRVVEIQTAAASRAAGGHREAGWQLPGPHSESRGPQAEVTVPRCRGRASRLLLPGQRPRAREPSRGGGGAGPGRRHRGCRSAVRRPAPCAGAARRP